VPPLVSRSTALEVARFEGSLVEGQATSGEKVGVITGAKREARSGSLALGQRRGAS